MKDEANCSSDQTRKCLRTGKFENLLLTGRKKIFFCIRKFKSLPHFNIFLSVSIKMISSLFESFVYGQNCITMADKFKLQSCILSYNSPKY